MTNACRSRFIASQGGLPVVLYPTDQFPTIASIPTGAVVYDTTDGGVVKKKVGDYLVDIQYNVIGYGPIASAPTASAGNNGAFWLETGNPLWPNGRVWGYRRGLQKSGSDRVTLPVEINEIVALSKSFTIAVFAQVESTTATCHFICKGLARADAKQLGILMYNGSFYGQIGGVSNTITATTEHKRLVLSNRNGSVKISDGTDVASFTAGAATSTSDTMLLSTSDTYSTDRFKLFGVEFYNSANADGTTTGLIPFAKWALDEPAGSTQLIDSVGGLVADVADGSPLGCVGTPMLVPFQW